MNDVLRNGALLRTTRDFPEDAKLLTGEINRSYVDIARGVNNRIIGFFPVNRSTINGEQWYITNNRRQDALRQVYRWDDNNLTITHGINFLSLSNFSRIWGTFFDGTNWQTLPYVDVVAVTNQIKVHVSPTQIIITKGAGAPACQNGLVVLEWISNP